MSLQPHVVYLVPDETARVARAAFPRGNNLAKLMRDHLGMIFGEQQFADLCSPTGQPAASPFCLALTTPLSRRQCSTLPAAVSGAKRPGQRRTPLTGPSGGR